MGRPWQSVSTAWRGLEATVQAFIEPIGKPKLIVEIGVDWGYSFFTFATLFPDARIIGVDNFSYHDAAQAKVHVEYLVKRDVRFSKCDLISMESAVAVEEYLDRYDQPIDVLHIDGDHSYEGVKRDFDIWSVHVRSGGVVLFHDIESFPDDVGRFYHQDLQGEKEAVKAHSGFGAWYKP